MKNLILERRDEKGREYEGMASPGRTPRLNEGQKDRTKERSRENPNATWRTPNNFRQLEKRKLVLYTFQSVRMTVFFPVHRRHISQPRNFLDGSSRVMFDHDIRCGISHNKEVMVPTGDVENIVNTIQLKDVVGTHSHDSQERKFYLIKYTFLFFYLCNAFWRRAKPWCMYSSFKKLILDSLIAE